MATIHKSSSRPQSPKVSVILLDWSCRERFETLDWLQKQDAPRDSYELIWVELFERVVPKAMEAADAVIICGQSGAYHKHKGYNAGLLQARGDIVTVCDSDAVFPPNFISSIVNGFKGPAGTMQPLVLMHHEYRTKSTYPSRLDKVDELKQFKWDDLTPNVGACMSVLRQDAIRFGGFDEHASYQGYVCGPYDLGWRLVNAGVPERWHDPEVALWHFAHPLPHVATKSGWFDSLKRWSEVRYPHIEYHALTAVEAFSTGRVLPLAENPDIHRLRMSLRKIGSAYEEKYANRTGPAGFSPAAKLKFMLPLLRETVIKVTGAREWYSATGKTRK